MKKLLFKLFIIRYLSRFFQGSLFIISFSLFTFHSFAQWSAQISGTGQDLVSVFFTDSLHGWAVGENGTILKYNGYTWTKQISGTKNWLNSVCFINKDTGYIVGDSGSVLQTLNGGNNWVILKTG